MKNSQIAWLIIATIYAGNGWSASYTVTDIGALSGPTGYSWPNAINNRGEVVGYSSTPYGTTHAFIWSAAEGIRDLGDLAGGTDKSEARDINENGQIVGYGSAATGLHAVLWNLQIMQDLGDLAGGLDTSDAYAINDNGVVAGKGNTDEGTRPFLWDQSNGMQELGILPDKTSATPFAINNAGEVAGMATDGTVLTAFRWSASTGMQDIGDLPTGAHVSYAYDINNKGSIVGRGNVDAGDRGFFWRSTSGLIDFGVPDGGYNSYAYGINDFHHVVGDTTGPAGHRASFWKDPNGPAQDLNELIDPASGWILVSAYDINDIGQIAGIGISPDSIFTGYVLSPQPELTAFWPADATQGASIFIFGSGFVSGQTQVTVNGISSPGVQWLSPDLVLALRPFGVTSGSITAITPYGNATAAGQYGTPPVGLTVAGIWPEQGTAWDFIFVFGSGFEPMNTQVSINGTPVSMVQIVNQNLLVFIVPPGLNTGPVTITTPAETAASLESFVVIP